MRRWQRIARAAAATLVAAGGAAGGTAWDEALDGDLATEPDTPTALAFAPGSNVVSGTVAAPDDTRDYLTFTLDSGQALTALLLLDYTDVVTGGPGNRGFYALNAGPTSFIPGPDTAGNFLGGNHLDPLPAGSDLLPALATAPLAGTGFSLPLGPGTYSFLVQQTGTPLSGYALDFVVVPEPGSLALLLAAAPLLAGRRRA